MTISQIKTVFFSYSWDDDAHKDWVRGLAERLVQNGVEVRLDQWDVKLGQSLTQFMDANLPITDYTLVVCTPDYAKKSVERKGGVGYESQIITAYVASGAPRSKFLPVIRRGSMALADKDTAIPPHFAGIWALDMREDSAFDRKFEDLIRHIYEVPELQRPALGAPPSFVGGAETNRDIDPAKRLRLAHKEIEHWELGSGVVRNELYPDTYLIPDEASRRSLEVGDFVKLSFEFDHPEGEVDPFYRERMWAKVVGASGPYYVGTLSNTPVCTSDWHDLDFDKEIVFLPEHVIGLDRKGEDAAAAEERRRIIRGITEAILGNRNFGEKTYDDVYWVIDRLSEIAFDLENDGDGDGEPSADYLWAKFDEIYNVKPRIVRISKTVWSIIQDRH